MTIAGVLLALVVLGAAPAYGFDEPHGYPELHQEGTVTYDCASCHRAGPSDRLCAQCHGLHHAGGPTPPLIPPAGQGPHGWYTATTDRCDACHTLHAAGGSKLLGASTVTDSCNICHDGTGGHGVFGSLAAQGVEVGATHRIDVTNTVPGGDAASGGSATMTFGGPGGALGCNDCHSPHDSNTVAPYRQERMRSTYTLILESTPTSKLLRQHPGGSTATATVYGSDWCLACHNGRVSGAAVHNHPVDSNAVTATPFSYDDVALLSTDTPTSLTVTGSMAATNRGYLMPFPRTPEQAGHSPICQQCHEDSRAVGELDADGVIGTTIPFSVVSTDGQVPEDNPRFQNFPHETANPRFLVETGDDLCLNCHPAGVLP